MLRALGVTSPLTVPPVTGGGIALTINGQSTQREIARFVGFVTPAGDWLTLFDNTANAIRGYCGYGSALFTAGANTDFGIASASTVCRIGTNGGSNSPITCTTNDTVLAGKLGINGVAAPAQVTGWGTPTGTGVVNNFAGASATLAQCSQAIAQLITDLKNLGYYAA